MNAAAIIPIVPAIRLKRILYATDFSESSRMALPVVSAIARHYQSEILVAHVWETLPYTMATPQTISMLEKQQEREVREKLVPLLRAIDPAGSSVKPLVRTGNPVQELERIVQEEAIDLVVLSTHGRAGVKRFVMGSVAEALLRNLSCPVLTVGPHLADRFRKTVDTHNILFPTNLSPESHAVFPYLASLAHEHGARLTLLHVLPPEVAGNPDAKNLAEPLRNEMIRRFQPEISPRCESEFVIDAGDTVEKILTHARDREAELIGLGIRKAPEITTHFAGTVTYRVLLNAACPVLTHRLHSQW